MHLLLERCRKAIKTELAQQGEGRRLHPHGLAMGAETICAPPRIFYIENH
jgi:hypothetical protein